MNEINIPAEVNRLLEVLSFVEQRLAECRCTPKIQTDLLLMCEEIFVNIAQYAYGDESGEASISVNIREGEGGVRLAEITFSDRGAPYNPLEKQDPCMTLPLEERPIGGLGVYLVKQMADRVSYEHEGGKNILTIIKKL